MTKPDKRLFDLPSLATLATEGKPSFSRKMGGVFEAVKFLTGETVASITHPAFQAAREELFRQVPKLEEACQTLPGQGKKKTWFSKLDETFHGSVELQRPNYTKIQERQPDPA